MFCPVMKLAPGPQRKRTAAAMSEGSPRRPTSARTSEWCCGTGCPAGRGAAIRPGVTVFTRILSGASSCASARVNPMSPALAVTTCGRRAAPVCAERPPMFTITPAPLCLRCGRQALTQLNAPSRITPVTARQSASVIVSSACSARTAALLTRMSMRPKREAAAATMVPTASASATSAVTANALPPSRSISRATASASCKFERALTTIAAPPSASASAMARPILRPAPVTMATRPESSWVIGVDPKESVVAGTVLRLCRGRATASPPPQAGEGQGGGMQQDGEWRLPPSPPSPASGGGSPPSLWPSSAQQRKVDFPIKQRAHQRERGLRPRRIPPAVARVERELLLDVAARQRLVRAAAHMRLALLDHAAVGEYRADVAGEIVGIRIGGVDLVAHFRGERGHARLLHGVVGEGVEPDIAAHEAGRDAVRGGKFSGIAVGRALLGGERLPQAMHRALADLADDFLDLLRLDAAGGEPPRAVDVGMRHRPAGIRFERERRRQPACAEIAGQRIVVAGGGVGEAVEKAVHAFEYGARAEETRAGEPRRAQPGLRRPARMQALGPRALREIFDDAAGHGTDDAE